MHCWYPFKIHDLLSAASSTERCWLWCKVMTSCEGGFHAGRCKLVYLSVHRPLVIGGVCNTFSLLDCLLGGTQEIPHTFVFFQLCLGLLPLYCHTRLFFFLLLYTFALLHPISTDTSFGERNHCKFSPLSCKTEHVSWALLQRNEGFHDIFRVAGLTLSSRS